MTGRPLAALAFLLALVACGREPTDIDLEMDTSAISSDEAERALDEIRNACRPLFAVHAADVRRIRATVSDEGTTQARRFGWGVYVEMNVDLVSSPTTLKGEVEEQARYLIGGGSHPGILAFSPTGAALCDLPLAKGRTNAFLPVPTLATELPRRAATPTAEQIAAHREEEVRAMNGDYQSQRNMAWCFLDGCHGVEDIDDVRACAWRLVIAASGHPKVDESDRENVAVDCDQALAPEDRATATAAADRLFQKIYKRPLP